MCIAPPTKQFLHVFAKEAVVTNTDRRRCMGRRRRAPPPLSSFTHAADLPMAAVAGDAENINKQARTVCAPTGSIKIHSRTSKRQTASCPRPQWGVAVPPSSADGPLRTDHVVPTLAVVGSLVMGKHAPLSLF